MIKFAKTNVDQDIRYLILNIYGYLWIFTLKVIFMNLFIKIIIRFTF